MTTKAKHETRLHAWKRVDCPECSTGAMSPVVDDTKPEGYDASRGWCYVCRRRIGAGPRYKSAAQRAEVLDRLHRLSTSDRLRPQNGLASFLLSRYGAGVDAHLRAWDVGTDTIGNTVYWYRDANAELQTAKIVPYNASTGKRRKGSDSPICWTSDDGKTTRVDVMFGIAEHQSKDDGRVRYASFSAERGYRKPLYGSQFVGMTRPDVPVLLVEAEKTAVVASMFLRSFVLVACGGAAGLTKDTASVLVGRDVFVLLDADDAGRSSIDGAVDLLHRVGARPLFDVEGRPLVDYLMPDAPKGYDLADYYLSQPELLPDLSVDIGSIPDLSVELDKLPDVSVDVATLPDLSVELENLPDVDCGIPQLPELDDFDNIWSRDNALEIMGAELGELPSIDTDINTARTMLLRVFGKDRKLADREFYRRVWTARMPGGSRLWTAGNVHKLTKPVYDFRSCVWSIQLLESAI